MLIAFVLINIKQKNEKWRQQKKTLGNERDRVAWMAPDVLKCNFQKVKRYTFILSQDNVTLYTVLTSHYDYAHLLIRVLVLGNNNE